MPRPGLPTIVFLHAVGTSGWMWEGFFAPLAGFNCLAPDLPGHGLSRAVPWTSMEDTADAIAALIRAQVPGGKAHIVGLSLGAYVGLTLMSRHPDTVERALLSGINVLPIPNSGLMMAASRLMAPLLKTEFGARMNARALNVPEADLAGYAQSMQQLSLRSFLAASDDAVRFRTPANIAAIANPTLLVAGERERSLVHQSIAALAAQMPAARQMLAPGLGHGWCAEDRDLFAATVAAWCVASPLPDTLLTPDQSPAMPAASLGTP